MRRTAALLVGIFCLTAAYVGLTQLTGAGVTTTPAAGPEAGLAPVVAPAAKMSPAARYSRKAHDATNVRRAERGVKAVKRQDCVQRFAVKQAKAMAAVTHMYHQELDPILKQCGLSGVGENVAYGYPNGKAVVRGWMGSDGHRANLLNGDWRLMGIGARKGADGLWYVSQVFGRKG